MQTKKHSNTILWFEMVDNHSDRNFTLKVSFSLTFLLFTRFCSIYDTKLATFSRDVWSRLSFDLITAALELWRPELSPHDPTMLRKSSCRVKKVPLSSPSFLPPTGGVWGQVTDHESQHFLVFFDLQVVVYLLGVCVLIIMQCGTNQRGEHISGKLSISARWLKWSRFSAGV